MFYLVFTPTYVGIESMLYGNFTKKQRNKITIFTSHNNNYCLKCLWPIKGLSLINYLVCDMLYRWQVSRCLFQQLKKRTLEMRLECLQHHKRVVSSAICLLLSACSLIVDYVDGWEQLMKDKLKSESGNQTLLTDNHNFEIGAQLHKTSYFKTRFCQLQLNVSYPLWHFKQKYLVSVSCK